MIPTYSNRRAGGLAPLLDHTLKDASYLTLILTQSIRGSKEKGLKGQFIFGQALETGLFYPDVFTNTCSPHHPSPSGL